MANNISVKYKGKTNELVIVLNEDADFDALKDEFTAKCAKSRGFFSSAAVSVAFNGRKLTKDEKEELTAILLNETNIIISEPDNGANNEPDGADAIKADEKRADEAEHKKDRAETTEYRREPEIHYGNAFFHKGTLRSGQDINYNGSVVVVGDVNPGGEIFAEGNIIVIGAVKGMVHAGCGGDKSCFVFALNLSPTQLRIADMIAYIPPELLKKNKDGASYAFIEDGQIFIKTM